jgi:AAA domain
MEAQPHRDTAPFRSPRADLAEIRRSLEALVEPGSVVELRALNVAQNGGRRFTVSGYFDDLEKMATEAAKLSGISSGVYFTLNPLARALLSRAANRVRPITDREPLTSDGDVLVRRWLPIDCDPVRPAGVSSSEDEHAAAMLRAAEIREMLADAGWPEPIIGDSGNGAHLVYRVDLPAKDDGLVKRVLDALAFRFDDDAVTVDRSVHNPSRIWKLYGTLAMKGDDTPERPHRLARVIVPKTLSTVAVEQLEAIAISMPTPEAPKQRMDARGDRDHRFDIDQWIIDHGLDVDGPIAWQTGRKWIFRICPWNADHRNRSAFIVQHGTGAIAAGCHHGGCADRGWHDLRDLVDAGWRDDRQEQRSGRGTESWDGRRDEPLQKTEQRIVAVTAAEFIAKPIPPREMILDPIIPSQGIVMVYALRGIGKTFFTLSAAYAIAVAGSFLRFKAARPRKVLYLDGEMPASAMQERIMTLVESFESEPPAADFFRLITPDLQPLGMPDLGTIGGQLDLDAVIDDAELIVIDNISTLCRASKENEAESWLPIQEWALRLRREGRSILFVHHAGKAGAQRGTSKREDVLDTVIELRRPNDYTPEDGARFVVDFTKARGVAGDGMAPFETKLEVVDNRAVWTTRTMEDAVLRQATVLFAEDYSTRDVAKELGITKSRADRLKKKAREKGLLES